jgi:hypothetical protein
MECECNTMAFNEGGRLDAEFVRVLDTNTVLLKPVGSETMYWLSITNLCEDDQVLLREAPELLRRGNAVSGFHCAVPMAGEWLPERLILSNSTAFYTWDTRNSEGRGTLTVEAFRPRVKVVIRNCPYNPSRWATNRESSRTGDAVFTRVRPKTNISVTAWCVYSGTVHCPNGRVTSTEKTYACKRP